MAVRGVVNRFLLIYIVYIEFLGFKCYPPMPPKAKVKTRKRPAVCRGQSPVQTFIAENLFLKTENILVPSFYGSRNMVYYTSRR